MQFTRNTLKTLKTIIDSETRKIQAAKKAIQYDVWQGSTNEGCRLRDYNCLTVCGLKAKLVVHHPQLASIDDDAFQTHAQTILIGETTIEQAQQALEYRSQQYGLLLAHSKRSDCIERALCSPSPRHVLYQFLLHKATSFHPTDSDVFFKTLQQLCSHILDKKGCKPANLTTLESTIDALIDTYQRAWTKAGFGIINSVIKLLITNGPICDENRAAYTAELYHHIGNIHAFFSSSVKRVMTGEITACVDTASSLIPVAAM